VSEIEKDVDRLYVQLLERAFQQVKPVQVSPERLKLPEMRVEYEGRSTVIMNFKAICEILRRDPRILASYFGKSLGASYSVEEGRLYLHARYPPDTLKSVLQGFFRRYVKCPICGSPDTELIRKQRRMELVCEACGAVSAVEKI